MSNATHEREPPRAPVGGWQRGPGRAAEAACKAIELAGFAALGRALVLPESLSADQRRVAESLLRGDFPYGGPLPATPRLLRRWLGVDPPGVLERRVDRVHEGAAVRWPLWKAWRDASSRSPGGTAGCRAAGGAVGPSRGSCACP